MNQMEMEFEYDDIDELLTVDTSSAYNFEKQQTQQAKNEWRYYRLYAQAIKEEQSALLDLEVTTAEVVEDILKQAERSGSPIPPSARSEVRRSKVPLDPRWRKAKREWIDKQELVNLMYGAFKSMASKGYRLNHIQKMVERQLFNTTYESEDVPQSSRITARNLDSKMSQSGAALL